MHCLLQSQLPQDRPRQDEDRGRRDDDDQARGIRELLTLGLDRAAAEIAAQVDTADASSAPSLTCAPNTPPSHHVNRSIDTRDRPSPRSPERSGERALEVLDQIPDVLEADGDTQDAIGDTNSQAGLRSEAPVRGGGRVGDHRLRVTQVV